MPPPIHEKGDTVCSGGVDCLGGKLEEVGGHDCCSVFQWRVRVQDN